MCIGTPMRIVGTDGAFALCESRGVRARIDLALVGELPVDTWILAFQGTAVRTMTEADAAATTDALAALAAVLAGEADVDRYFADLHEREPALPPHLRKA